MENQGIALSRERFLNDSVELSDYFGDARHHRHPCGESCAARVGEKGENTLKDHIWGMGY
ncbi:MAG: hypothetical protein ACLR0U_09730 [Enterocloster clostridioformis]